MSVPVELLRCPVSGQALVPAAESTVIALQTARNTGAIRNRDGELPEPFEAGLQSADGVWFYPIRSGIPVLLAGEAMTAAQPG